MPDKLTRKELLELLQQSPDEHSSLDELDRKALEGYQYLDSSESANKVLDRLDGRFEKWVQQREVSKAKRVRSHTILLIQRIAAVVLLVLIPAIFVFRPAPSLRLANQYFEAPRSPYLMLNRGDQPAAQTNLMEAFALYEKGEYSAAAIAIESLTGGNPEKKDLKFYLAISLLASDQVDKSIPLLQASTQETYQDLHHRAPWYLALAYLKQGQEEKAVEWLEKAVQVDALHRDEAAIILDKIK